MTWWHNVTLNWVQPTFWEKIIFNNLPSCLGRLLQGKLPDEWDWRNLTTEFENESMISVPCRCQVACMFMWHCGLCWLMCCTCGKITRPGLGKGSRSDTLFPGSTCQGLIAGSTTISWKPNCCINSHMCNTSWQALPVEGSLGQNRKLK